MNDAIRTAFSRLDAQAMSNIISRSRIYLRELNQAHNAFETADSDSDLDPLPYLLTSDDIIRLSKGISEWGSLLEAAYRDLHGDQKLIHDCIVPAKVFWDDLGADPGFFRILPDGSEPLDLFRLDLLRFAGKGWAVAGIGSGVVTGLGYALENRIVHTRVLGSRVPRTNVVRLAGFFQALKDRWFKRSLSHRDEPSIMVWTPGPTDPHYFEHVYLSRYFGYPLIESRDLTVRGGKVYLKMLGGLQIVDVLVRMVPDRSLDPLSGSPPALDGIAGLLQAFREGHVLVSNAPGTDLLEHPALLPLYTEIAHALVGQDLSLPVVSDLALHAVLSPESFWEAGKWLEKPLLLRVFAQRGADGWEMMPGGLAQAINNRQPSQADLSAVAVSALHSVTEFSGARKDVWVMSEKRIPYMSLLPQRERPSEIIRSADLPSRVADDLFWLGRYAERAWLDLRFMEKYWEISIEGEQDDGGKTAAFLSLSIIGIEAGPSSVAEGRPDFAGWRLWSTLAEIARVSAKVRDRLSLKTHRIIAQFAELLDFDPSQPTPEILDRVGLLLAAFNGMTIESMTRSSGWRFLDAGRRLERAQLVLEVVSWFVEQDGVEDYLPVLLEIFDSLMTYRTRYRLAPQIGPVLDLLLLDETNPRSLAYQIVQLQSHVDELPRQTQTAYRSREERSILELLTKIRLTDGSELAGNGAVDGKLHSFLSGLSKGLDIFSDALHATYLAKIEALHVIQAKRRIDEASR